MDFDNITELLREIKKETYSAMATKVIPEIEQVVNEESEHIYDMYAPQSKKSSRWRQGLPNGFGDKENIKSELHPKSNGDLSVEITNETKSDNKSNLYLDYIIEYGRGYDYGNVPPRPFAENSMDRLESEEIVENMLKSGLKARGIDVE